jgi:transcription initiation factor TFIID subunit 10
VTAHYLTLAGLPPPSATDPTGASTNTTPLPLARLLALATQKFVADIAADAYQYSRIRSSNSASANNPLGGGGTGGGPPSANVAGAGAGLAGAKGQQGAALGVQRAGFGGGGQGGSGQGRTVLTMEDLGMAVQEYGVNVKRGEFYR